MIINLVPDSSVASAPPGFIQAVEQAAQFLGSLVKDNITINIAYGWGTYNDQSLDELNGATKAIGGYINARFVPYATVKSWLAADATSALDLQAVASLPADSSAVPGGRDLFVVSTAQEKAMGHFTGDTDALDGAIGFGTGTDPSFWYTAAIHEMTHAMGRISGYPGGSFADLLDLFRYSAPGSYQWTGTQPAYFSVDGGVTDIANFSLVSDYADWANDSLTPNDPFDAYIGLSALTTQDLAVIDAMGFNIGTPLTVSGGESQTVSAVQLSGGIALDGGTLRIVSGGATLVTSVEAGGNEIVSSGGRASGTVVSSGGVQIVSGGTAFGTSLLNGATVEVTRGGALSAAQVGSGGGVTVSNGGISVSATVADGGNLTVRRGGDAGGTILLSGAEEIVLGQGVAHGTVIDGGATQVVSSGGSAIGARVSSGGIQSVLRGGMASCTTVSAGGTALVSGSGVLRGALVESGGTLSAGSGGCTRNATVQSGGTIVFAGGSAAGLTADSGALEEIAANSTASGLTVSAGVTLTVSQRATAAGLHVLSGGLLVYDGGVVRTARIDSGGQIEVASGVTVVSLTAGDGVTLDVASGATARLTTLSGGTEIVAAGGRIGGPVTFAGNSELVLASAAGTAPKLSGFGATDRLDLGDFAFSDAEHASFVANGRQRGILTVTDGALSVSVTLFGQYAAQGFHLADDGHGGTAITYGNPAPSGQDGIGLAAAASHAHA